MQAATAGDSTIDSTTFIKTPAICLRIIPFSRTSHIVSWLTPDDGLIRTVVKGACRPKSWFLGQYDLFQTVEIVLYARARNGLHILKEACVLQPRTPFRQCWRAAAVASYLCDVLARNLVGNEHAPGCFTLLSDTLDALLRKDTGMPLLFWFELHIAHAMGLAPALERCTVCTRTRGLSDSAFFSPRQGGLVCASCLPTVRDRPQPIGPDRLSLLRHLQRTASPQAAGNIRCSTNQSLAISALLGIFMLFHLEINSAARDAAVGLAMLGRASDAFPG